NEAMLEDFCHYLFHHLFTCREYADVKTLMVDIFKHFRTNQDSVAILLLSSNAYFLIDIESYLKQYIFPKLA
ncbi:TetR/AcrR family transcriptional regulator, partial [Streptococcus suis]